MKKNESIQEEVGFVSQVNNFLLTLDGLPSARIFDLVEGEDKSLGWVAGIREEHVEVLLLSDGFPFPGQRFKKLPRSLSLRVGEKLIGRVINPLGQPLDGKKPITENFEEVNIYLDRVAPGIDKRRFIGIQLDTGVTLIDTLFPLGKGQRELIIGDARSGKTDFLIDLVVNQKYTNALCIWAIIGKPLSEIKNLVGVLEDCGAIKNTIVIAAASSEANPLIYLSPHTALTLAEYFQAKGRDVLVILDDMGIHAKIYREIALLSDRPPGRQSYPGDMFHQHAMLLERAGSFLEGGTITILPVIELNLTDFTTLVPTNLMATTDGHLLFRGSIYNQGQRPAVDISLSVSRVGHQTQPRLQKLLADEIKQVLAHARDLETVSRFSFELPKETREILWQKDLITDLLKQEQTTFLPKEAQVLLLGLVFTDFFKEKKQEEIEKCKKALSRFKDESILKLSNTHELVKWINSKREEVNKLC